MKEKTRLLLISDAVISTGFSTVMHSIVKYFDLTKYSISWLGVNYFGFPHKYPYRIYPASAGGDLLGFKLLDDVLNAENPQIIFILNDAWGQHDYLKRIKEHYKDSFLPKIVTYTPVDALIHDPAWYQHFDIVTPVAYTEFGKQEILSVAPELKVRIIPHGIDSSVFFKMDKPKNEIKKEYFKNHDASCYEDSFVVLNANRNQKRKKLEIGLEAFTLFSRDKPDNVKFYSHCGVKDAAVDVMKLATRFGIGKRLIITNLKIGPQQVPSEQLNHIYNATDVGINSGLGEGWGLPNCEHAVTGAPQVVANHSALHELYYDIGVLIQPIVPCMLEDVMTVGGLIRAEDMAEGLEILYKDKELYNLLSTRSTKKFSGPEYSWENISHQWDVLFDEVLNAD